MTRIAEHLVPCPLFDDLAEVHHGHVVADVAHGGEVMRDHHDPDPEPVAQVGEEGKDRRLH